MVSTKNARVIVITFLVIFLYFSSIAASSPVSNQNINDEMTSIQSNQITWNLTITYTIKNDSNGIFFEVLTSLTFFKNMTLFNYVNPSIDYWIYNSTNDRVFTMTPSQITVGNKSYTANQSITSGISTPLTRNIIPRSDTYTINVSMHIINRTYLNSFSAIVTNNSIRINFKNNVTTDTGIYNVNHNSISSFTATITKSHSLPIDYNWFLLAFFPMIIFSKQRRKNNKLR